MVAIVNKRPEQMGLAQLIDAFLAHKEEVVINRLNYIYKRLEARLHIVAGLIKAVSVMDDIIRIIRASKNKADAKVQIINAYDFSDAQAEAIVTLQLYRLSSTDINILEAEYKDLSKQKNEIFATLNNSELLKQLINKELSAINDEFKIERRSKIEAEIAEIELDKTDLITNEAVKISVSQHGYIKRVSLRSFNMSESDMPGLKENDHLIGSLEVQALDTLLLFLDNGSYVYLPVFEINEHRWNDLGSHISSYAKNTQGVNIVSVLVVSDFSSEAYITMVSKLGKVKITKLDQYEVVRYSSAISSMNLKDDTLVSAYVTYSDDDLILLTKFGFYNYYNNDEISVTNLRSQGIIGINLGKDDEVVSSFAINKDSSHVIVLNEKGGLKRIKLADLSKFKRTVKGEMIFKQTPTNPQFIRYGRAVVNDDIIVFYDDKSLSVNVVDIALMGIDQSFSRPLTLKNNWYLVSQIIRVLYKAPILVNEQTSLEI